MYRRIVLAYDGSTEGRRALREGALLAKTCNAEVYLLSVVAETAGMMVAEGAYAGAVAQQRDAYEAVLREGAVKLKELGFKASARLVSGEPAQAIAAFAREVGADLVVVGHKRRNLVERWWGGSSGAYLMDHIHCSLLLCRNEISDEQLAQAFGLG